MLVKPALWVSLFPEADLDRRYAWETLAAMIMAGCPSSLRPSSSNSTMVELGVGTRSSAREFGVSSSERPGVFSGVLECRPSLPRVSYNEDAKFRRGKSEDLNSFEVIDLAIGATIAAGGDVRPMLCGFGVESRK